MMALLGILGIIQNLVLPGLVILRLLKIRGGALERLIYMMPLSLIANYLLVYSLTLIHLYNQLTILVVILLEIIFLIISFWRELGAPISRNLRRLIETLKAEFLAPLNGVFAADRNGKRLFEDFIWCASGVGVISAILWGAYLCRLNIGKIFTSWDVVYLWNHYAQEFWAKGSVPLVHGTYPQLISTNYSISYVLQGVDAVQYFNMMLPPVFFLWIMLMFFDLGFQRKESGFFIAAIIARYMMKKLMGTQLYDGYLDVPVACMMLCAVYAWLKGEFRDLSGQRQAMFLGFLIACGAAVTKQMGMLAVIFAPLLVWMWLRDAWKSLNKKVLLQLILIGAVVVLPWYATSLWHDRSPQTEGGEVVAGSLVEFVVTYEWSYKFRLALQEVGKYAVVFILSLIGLPWIPKKYRLPFFLLSWPVTLIWITFLTYDVRNLSTAMPFVSLSCGFALSGFADWLCGALLSWKAQRIPSIILILGILLGSALLAWKTLPNDLLVQKQREDGRKIFGERLNRELLYGIVGPVHHEMDIVTDYAAYYLTDYRDCCDMVAFKDTARTEYALNKPTTKWLLAPQNIADVFPESGAAIERCIAEGRCVLSACSDGYFKPYCLYMVNNQQK